MTNTAIVDAIKKLTRRDLVLFCGSFLFTIAPGFLTIFHFLPKVAESYNFSKLVLLSLSMMLPVAVSNLFIFYAFNPKSDPETLVRDWLMAGIPICAGFYPTLYLAYYCSLKFPTFLLIALLINYSFCAVLGGGKRIAERTSKSKP